MNYQVRITFYLKRNHKMCLKMNGWVLQDFYKVKIYDYIKYKKCISEENKLIIFIIIHITFGNFIWKFEI